MLVCIKCSGNKGLVPGGRAEMVVRELERGMAQQVAKKASDSLMLRALDCFGQGVCFLDTAADPWRPMHCNSVLAEARASGTPP